MEEDFQKIKLLLYSTKSRDVPKLDNQAVVDGWMDAKRAVIGDGAPEMRSPSTSEMKPTKAAQLGTLSSSR